MTPDNDQPYTFGRPLDTYVAPVYHPHLVVLRGLVQDARAGAPPDSQYRLSLPDDLAPEAA